MTDPTRYALKHPLVTKFRGPEGEREETLTELTLRRLKGKDLRHAPGNQNDMVLHMIARSTGLTAMQVDELDLEDIAGLGEVIEDFMPDGLAAGKTSSAT